ncbi:VWA domain-containing protein [Rhizocola hellebori]|uniref:VWA domain-containing protein n=1 Tax=Rhizocola hellebori TaxID=1392758 RepID=A0A8J3Q6B7_9ACTN|nr:VWA domain-containing protein [Rhizocola hellebori]
MVIPLALVLVGSGLTFAYAWIKEQGCSGSANATIVAPANTAALLRVLANQWSQTQPKVNGTCASVTVREQDTSVTAQALSHDWDPAADGPAPDVWVPQASAWARAAAANSATADKLMPDKLPSIARTPVVIAMPKTLAESYGWPKSELDWKDLLDKLAANPEVKIGMSDPATSTAGLLALSSIIDANDDADVDAEEIKRVFTLEQRVAVYKPTTEELFAEYVSGKGATLSAFPALEQDVVKHNETNPSLALVAVYPKNATTEADHPFMMLKDAPWKDAKRQDAAAEFLKYVKGEAGRTAVLDEGFRDSNRAAGPKLTPAKGVVTKLTALPRAVLLADAIDKTVSYWNALTRPSNVLLVLDVSGSMKEAVPGTGLTKLDLTKNAAQQVVKMFGDDSQVGLWIFAAAAQGNAAYKELVKVGKLAEGDRRKKLGDEITKLVPGGNTGMYDSIWAAHQSMVSSYAPGTESLVVLLTDGADDNRSTLKLPELTDKLKNADKTKPVKVVTIALGAATDNQALTDIAVATGATPYTSSRAFDIDKVLISALFDIRATTGS